MYYKKVKVIFWENLLGTVCTETCDCPTRKMSAPLLDNVKPTDTNLQETKTQDINIQNSKPKDANTETESASDLESVDRFDKQLLVLSVGVTSRMVLFQLKD